MTAINTNPGWTLSYVPSPAQWAAAFGGKVDGEAGQADNLLINSGTIAGTIAAAAGARIAGTLAIDALLVAGEPAVTSAGPLLAINAGTVTPGTMTSGGLLGYFGRTSPGTWEPVLLGNGLTSDGDHTIHADVQGTIAAATTATVIVPYNLQSVVVNLAANTTIDIEPALYVGQHLRLELKQDGTGTRTVALGSSIVTGTDITGFTASTAPNTRDMLLLFAINDGSHWALAAVNHGFGI